MILVCVLESLEDAGSEHNHDDDGHDHVHRQQHLPQSFLFIVYLGQENFKVKDVITLWCHGGGGVMARFDFDGGHLPEDGVGSIPELCLLLHGDGAATQVWGGRVRQW